MADTLTSAEALVARGAIADAIELLTEANRARRDPQIEERLVTLRHEAFTAFNGGHTNAPPPITAIPPGDVDGLPELRPVELTPASLRDGLARHGCVLVRGLLPAVEATDLATGIDRVLAAFDAGTAGEPPAQTSPWYVPFTPTPGRYRVGGRRSWVRASGGVWTVDSPRMLFELLEVLEHTGLTDLITTHLGERPALSANKCTLRRVPVTTNTDWHQDGAFLGRDVRSLNVWLSLSHCGTDAPGLDLVPRRLDEVVATGTDGAYFDWSVSPEVVSDVAGDAGVLRPTFAPGDALLFDHLLLHRTAIDPGMTRDRHAIETWHFAPSAYPDGQIPIVC